MARKPGQVDPWAIERAKPLGWHARRDSRVSVVIVGALALLSLMLGAALGFQVGRHAGALEVEVLQDARTHR